MLEFKAMIENVRACGGVFASYAMDDRQDIGHFMKRLTGGKPATEQFFRLVEAAEIFIVPPLDQTVTVMMETANEELDLPFPICVFECMSTCWAIGDTPGQPRVELACVLVHERAPRDYEYFAFLRPDSPDPRADGARVHYIESNNPIYAAHMATLVRENLKLLSRSRIGEEKVKERIKLGVGKAERRVHTIRRVLRIVPRKLGKTVKPLYGRVVEFSHRWSVRGTWVTFWKDDAKTEVDMSRVGKDRNGDYGVRGYTWRVEHIKGPEDKPLVKKTRVIAPDEPGGSSEQT